jgi:putative heme-binding domain-containing protein
MPRYELPVTSISNDLEGCALVVRTELRQEAVNYALKLGSGDSEINVLSDLTGVEAVWESASGKTRMTNWLPHLDLKVASALTAASANHMAFFKSLSGRGNLTLRGQIDLWQMLHPAVQPDAKLDYEYPPEEVTLVLASNAKIKLKTHDRMSGSAEHEARISLQPKENHWVPFEVALPTGGHELRLDVSWFTVEDSRPRPLPLRRLFLPWAKPYAAVAMVIRTPELEGGDWESGRKIFFGDQVGCYKCHQIGGEGGMIGANLSNLIYRDYASVLRDITEPSAAINPDHISYNVKLKDGEVETGVMVKNSKEEVVLGLVTGKDLKIPKDKVESMKASSISLMPEGLLKGLSAQDQKDLMTFLLTTPTKR